MKKNIPNLTTLIEQLQVMNGVEMMTPDDPQYATARLIYNRMHDGYPALIVQTLNSDALRLILAYTFKHDIVLAIRGGGHHIGGFGTCNDGILIDFSRFKTIQIDENNLVASVEPGVCLGDLDNALTKAGYIVPTGTVSETGIAGLTLGGGIGWLVGKYGLTCDQLCGATVLLANGELVYASESEHKDLLWALRGGGGNFGLVLNFKFRLNPLPKTICGMGVVSSEHINIVMVDLIQYLENKCPPSMTVAPIFIKTESGNTNLRIDFCSADGTDEEVIALTSLSRHIAWSNVREWAFSAWQKEFDHSFLPPMRGYWKAAYLQNITPENIKAISMAFEKAPSFRCAILIEHLHGAFTKCDQIASAFPLRHCTFGILISARWEDMNNDEEYIGWVRNTFNQLDPKATSATYLNYTGSDDNRAIKSLMSGTLSKIATVKSIYDPHNYFKRNHNVLPSS